MTDDATMLNRGVISCALCCCAGRLSVELDAGETVCCEPTEADVSGRDNGAAVSVQGATTERAGSQGRSLEIEPFS